MEPWTYPSEGRGLWFSDEIDLPMDACSRSRKPLTEWGIRAPNHFENHGLVSNREAIESMEFVELGFPDMMGKSFHSNLNVGFLGGEIGGESRKRVASPTYLSTSKFSSGKEESGSILLSSPLMESNSHDSSLIDLKLGRLADSKDAHIDNILKEISVLSSVGSPLLEKRAPKMNSDSRTPFCQVQGCNKDLSSSKEYHKRHKVCDVHSKTPKVIVNGIEKRFCQQCSRFHLLVEFDDGKRSCRKRLAGHNKRRRKPQFDILSGKPHKLLQSYQDIHPGGVLYPGKYEQANQHVKLKEESISFPQMAIPIAEGQMLPKFFLHLHGVGKQYSSGIPSLGIEDYSVFDTASTVQDSPGVSSTSCALSLLSARSQDSPSHSAGIPTTHPLIIQGSRGNHHMGHIFDKPLGLSSLDKYTPNGFYSSGIYPKEVDKMGLMVSDAGHSSDFEVRRDENLQGANLLNTKHQFSPEYGATVDLLQLSSHLQRVERQRNSMQLEQENGDFFCFQAT